MVRTPKGETDILLALFKYPEKDLSASELARMVGLTRMGSLTVLKKLEKQEMVRVRKVGKTSIYSIELQSPHTRKYLTYLLSYETEHTSPYVRRWIRELRRLKYAKAAILFGSVLHKEKNAHDIDVLLITDAKSFKNLEKEIDTINRLNSKLIHPVYQSVEDFRKNLRKKDPVILNALKGVVAFGEEVLYEPRNQQS